MTKEKKNNGKCVFLSSTVMYSTTKPLIPRLCLLQFYGKKIYNGRCSQKTRLV
jgi:ABC-type uncharacterized transport system ATPase subunit